MAYYLGKDVNVYWTTEHRAFVVSGTADEATTGSSLVGWDVRGATVTNENENQAGGNNTLVQNRSYGAATSSL